MKGGGYSCCLHLFTVWPLIHFENEMGVKQEPACVCNKKCHEQNRYIPSAEVIGTKCIFGFGQTHSVGVEYCKDMHDSAVQMQMIEKSKHLMWKCSVYSPQGKVPMFGAHPHWLPFTNQHSAAHSVVKNYNYRLWFNLWRSVMVQMCLSAGPGQAGSGKGFPTGTLHVWIDRTIRPLPDM